MRYGRYHLRQSWIFLLMWFLCSIGCPSPSSASTTHVLRDVQMVYQDGQWHVVLTGSQAMTYRALKAFDPPRLIVDLINTLNKMPPWPFVLNNEVIGTVTTVQLVREPQPRTRVDISLTRDAPHKITRSGEKIWISFDTTQSKIEVEPSRTEPVAKPKAQQPPVTKEVATPESSPKKPTPDPPPPPLERKSLPPASKVLSVLQSKMDEELRYDIIVDGSLADYVAFHLTNPPRVVVDLMGVKSTVVEKALNFDGPWVKGVRFGVYTSKVRVVFDIIPEAGLPYDIILEEGRLVVSFKPGSGFPAQ